MTTIVFIQATGTRQKVNAEAGQSVMQIALLAGLDGILAECGGNCSCATCHVYVDPAWVARVPAPEDFEQALLDGVLEPRENSRLSCQIQLTPDLCGLVLHVPARQL